MRTRTFRRGNDPDRAETFASRPIDLNVEGDRQVLSAAVGRSRKDADRAWKWHDAIGEIHYSVSRAARQAGYADLAAYEIDEHGRIGKRLGGIQRAIVDEHITSRWGGQRGLVERFFTHIKIPGDTFLINTRRPDGSVSGIDFVCAREWSRTSLESLRSKGAADRKPLERITLPGSGNSQGQLVEHVRREDMIGRVWRPSGTFVEVADSPMFALDTECEVLDLLTRGIKSKLTSRLMMSGIQYVPSEVNLVRSVASDGEKGKAAVTTTVEELLKAYAYNAKHPDEPLSIVPIMMSGPGDQADNVKFITMDREIFEVEMKLRTELRDAILFGLDINPEGVKGTSDANHWGAWAASDDEQRINVKPDLEVLCWALTGLVLRPEMVRRGAAAGKVNRSIIWYDMSKAVAKSNVAEDARQLHDRAAIGEEALRRYSGVDERDAADGVEKIRIIGLKLQDPYLATYGLEEAKNLDWAKVGAKSKTGPAPDSPADPSTVQPGKGQPGSPNDIESDTPRRLRPG